MALHNHTFLSQDKKLYRQVTVKDMYHDTLVDTLAKHYFRQHVNRQVNAELDFILGGSVKLQTRGKSSHKFSRAPMKHLLTKLEHKRHAAQVLRSHPHTVPQSVSCRKQQRSTGGLLQKQVPMTARSSNKLPLEGKGLHFVSNKSTLSPRPFASRPCSGTHSAERLSLAYQEDRMCQITNKSLAMRLSRVLFRTTSNDSQLKELRVVGQPLSPKA
jgi:hypothetical protein